MVCPENGFELFEPEGFDEDEQPATSTAAIAAVTSTSGIRFFPERHRWLHLGLVIGSGNPAGKGSRIRW